MRSMVFVCLLMVGCAPVPSATRYSPERNPDLYPAAYAPGTEAALDPGFSDRGGPATPLPREVIARDNQARAICQARGQLREQAQPYRGILNLENIVAGGEAMRICMDTYRATGIMPSY